MENSILQQIGRRIQLRRKQLGYTQEQLAGMMDVSIQMVSNLERGNKEIRIHNLLRLCEVLRVSADYILSGKASPDDANELSRRLNTLSQNEIGILNAMISFCEQRHKKSEC